MGIGGKYIGHLASGVFTKPPASVRIVPRQLNPWGPERRQTVWQSFGTFKHIETAHRLGTTITGSGITDPWSGQPRMRSQSSRWWGFRITHSADEGCKACGEPPPTPTSPPPPPPPTASPTSPPSNPQQTQSDATTTLFDKIGGFLHPLAGSTGTGVQQTSGASPLTILLILAGVAILGWWAWKHYGHHAERQLGKVA